MPAAGSKRVTLRGAVAQLKELLQQAAAEDRSGYEKIVRAFRGKVASVLLEETDEHFYIRGDVGNILAVKGVPPAKPSIDLILSRRIIGDILTGKETPVEAFFLGHIRAKGTTRDLYQVHSLFISMAEIAVRSRRMQAMIEKFINASDRKRRTRHERSKPV